MSEVRGSGRECQAVTAQEWPGRATQVQGQGQKPGGPEGRRPREVTPRLRSGAAAESARLRQCRNGREELPKSEVRGGSREELPRV